MFSSTTCLTVVFSYGMAPAPYFRRGIVGDHSLLFFTFVIYYNIFYFTIIIICNCLPGVPKSDSRSTWRWRRFFISSVEDTVLERSAALESFCYSIGFGRLGRRPLFIMLYVYMLCNKWLFFHFVAVLRLVRTWSGTSLQGVPLSLPLGAVMVALVDVSGLSIYCYRCQYTSGVAHCSYHVRYIHTNRRLPPSIISG